MSAMESTKAAELFRRQAVVALGLVVLLISMFVAATPAAAVVSVSRAEVSGTNLRIEGTATASRDITVDGVVMGRSATDGRFRIERSGYTSPADCTVDVNDGSATSRTATLSGCTVSSPSPPPSTLAIDDRPLPDGNVGTDYANFVTATGGSGSIRWSIAAGALPAGLALTDFAPSSGLISGRPTTAQASTFTVRATDDAGNTATRQFTISINAARPLVITSPSQLPDGTVGAAYAVGVFADGGTTPYSWTRTAGTLPPGLALQASPGRIQGTPTTAGTFSFTLRVADSAGQSATGTFSITISAPGPAPQPPQTAPALLSPAEGASVVTPFTISWQAVSDPQGITHYNWQLGTTSAFTTLATAGTVAGDATQASVSSTLANGTYFWRVQAVNPDGTGPYSAARSVTVTGTTNPSVLTGVSVNPANVTGGSSATGSVSISPAAPAAGAVVTLSSSEPAVAGLPSSVTVPAGQTGATFTVTTQSVTSSFTVVITARLGEERFAFLGVAPAAPPPAADSVAIQRAEYDARKRSLTVEATSNNSSAVLSVFRTSTDVRIGTMNHQGGGRYRATFNNVATNPESVTVKSSLGGSATRAVTLK